ncbi:phospholipase D-like domain-containing protein, partial [Citrobacter portucalensis]
KMPAFEWVHVQLHQQKGMISLSPPTICNSAADEKANSDRYTAVTYLINQGVPVHLNGRYAIMHNKFMVIDGKNVQTGSFNYTASAVSRNAENVLLIEDAPQLAEAYQREFNRLWDEGIPLNALY